MLLLQHNADVCIINGEGRLPRDMTQSSESGREISKLLRAAEQTEILRKETKLLSAARSGDVTLLNRLVSNVNDVNEFDGISPIALISVKRSTTSAKY